MYSRFDRAVNLDEGVMAGVLAAGRAREFSALELTPERSYEQDIVQRGFSADM